MKTKSISLLMLTLSVLFGFSCSDDNDNPEQEGLILKTVKAESCVDLSERSNWDFMLGYGWRDGIKYNFRVDGKKIEASFQAGDAYYFPTKYNEGDIIKPNSGDAYIRFVSPEYFPTSKTTTRSLPAPPPQIQDQSTREKLILADALYCKYSGIVSSDLTGIELIHENILLDFQLVDVPEGAKVVIEQNYPSIKPFRENPTQYKAIVLHTGFFLVVTVNGIHYSSYFESNRNDTYFKFDVKINTKTKELDIENQEKSKWSETFVL